MCTLSQTDEPYMVYLSELVWGLSAKYVENLAAVDMDKIVSKISIIDSIKAVSLFRKSPGHYS